MYKDTYVHIYREAEMWIHMINSHIFCSSTSMCNRQLFDNLTIELFRGEVDEAVPVLTAGCVN